MTQYASRLLQPIYCQPLNPLLPQKSCIWKTPTPLACEDSSTNTMKSRLFVTLFCTFWHFLAFFCCILGTFLISFLALFVTKKTYVSCVTCHMSSLTCHIFHVTCQLSHVTSHLSLKPTATDLPLLTPLSTVD